MNRTLASFISLCAIFVIVHSTARASSFTNGSFEMAGLPPGSFNYLQPDDTSLVGWSIGNSGGPVGYVSNGSLLTGPTPGLFDAVDGTHQVSFNTGDQSTGNFISQMFDTVIGQKYALTFFVGRLGFDRQDANISLTASVFSATDDALASLQATPPGLGYGSGENLFFTATSALTTLRFTDTSRETRAVDLMLDGVAVTAIPEPSMFALAASGLFGIVASVVSQRRTRRGSLATETSSPI